jgi:hypothetical protein
MAHARYRTPEYKRALTHWTAIVRTTGTHCHERVCILGDRQIPAGSLRRTWDLAHDRSTGAILGPAHRPCNRAEGARYRNAHHIPPERRRRGRTCHICGQRYDASYPAQRTCSRRCGAVLVRQHPMAPNPSPRPATPRPALPQPRTVSINQW